ncbi:MAG: hypothetical protein LBP67_06890 [Bacteroidales bacterium]|jgi:hypothetical protein|nr:hypothetical protein [Bacteroidales bacterium]
MIKQLRATFLLVILGLVYTNTICQDLNSAIINDYNRNSISEIFIRYSDSYNSDIQKMFENRSVSEKFDVNEISLKYINSNESRNIIKDDTRINPNRTAAITNFLNERNIGLEVVSYIFNRDANGKMDLSRIHERGLYTAKDTDVRLSGVKVRGLFEMEDYGHELISKSYIIVYDFVNIRTEYNNIYKEDYYKGQISAYVFEIQWNDEIQAMIFDSWIDDDTPQDQIAEKIKAYNNIYIPVKCDLRATTTASTVKDKSNDFKTWLAEANNNISHEIQKNFDDFAVISAITNLNPIRSKIGLKEGLKPGLRFYVYENVMKGDGNIAKSRQGVLRATHNIVDNRYVATGQNPESEFRQIAGNKLELGQSLMEKRDLGFSLSAGYASTLLRGKSNDSIAGNIGGAHIDIGYEIFMKSKLMSSYTMIACNIEASAFNVALSYYIGLSIRNFEILPFVGFGLDHYSVPDSPDIQSSEGSKYGAWFVQGGLRMHVNIYYPVQFFAACEWNQIVSIGDYYDELSGTIKEFTVDNSLKHYKYRSLNGLHTYGGIRICF